MTDPWILVAGGFHRKGGMDRANLALAEYLTGQGIRVHIIAHAVDEGLHSNPLVTVHKVGRPLNSFAIGRPFLDFRARTIARQIISRWPHARVVVNGANCRWPDMNWAHCVHHAWEPDLSGMTPIRGNVKRFFRALELRRERLAYRDAQLIFANSESTKRHLVDMLGIDECRVKTVYLGCEPGWLPPSSEERLCARNDLALVDAAYVAAFVGAVGRDNNKGLDTLAAAWKLLCADPAWDVDLVVAGDGPALAEWRVWISKAGLSSRIRLLGFRTDIKRVLAASDILVSPVRYEAYGLNVHEAICCGLPAIVSQSAGVAERYPSSLRDLLLPDPRNVNALVDCLRLWRANADLWKQRFQPFGAQLRLQTWDRMAAELFALATSDDAEDIASYAAESSR